MLFRSNLVKAGYHPESMGEMFENMNEIRRLSGDLPPEFLLTHPLSSSRISDAFNAAENLPTEGTKKNSLEFSLIKARLEIYYENISQNSLRKFRERVNQDPTESNLYGLALAHQKNNNYEESIRLCHSTVGVAILNTSITIIFGFSILVLSNFIPTIYFGIFTGIAMLLAMILVLTLLPKIGRAHV